MGTPNRTQYLRVRNWEKFQHYKDRRPPWIKYHVSSLDDYELTSLNLPAQLVYDRLLLLAAKTDNNIPNDHGWIANQTHIDRDIIGASVETLATAGFLVISESKRAASKVIAARKQRASKTPASRAPARSQETETETERDKEENPRAVPVVRDAAEQPQDQTLIKELIERSLKVVP